MAADCKDVNVEMSLGSHGDGDSRNHEDGPSTPLTVPTVSEKVPTESVDGKKARVPRRVLHFSDGTLEEYSTEEEDEPDQAPDTLAQLRTADTKSMGWLPWAWYWFRLAGYSTLGGMDRAGERLAYMLGITSPKYQYELDEYYELKRKEEEEKHQRDLESAGWTPGTALTNQATNPATYAVGADQSEPAAAAPGQAPPPDADVVSGQPVAAGTMP